MPDRFVEHLAGGHSADDFFENEFLLLLDFLEEASVLVRPPGQVGQHLQDGAVRYVFVGGVTGLTWKEVMGFVT